MNNTPKAVIYVRVSTEEQAKKGYSIDGQIQRCIEYAKRMGYTVITVFKEEGRSAKNLDRPELQKMLQYFKQNYKNINALIFWKWDRLSRGEDSDYVELGTIFKKYDIKPLSTEENNDNSPEAKLMRRITFATSTYELDKDSQRTKLGMRRKAESGCFPAKAPIGYLNKRDSEDKGIIVLDDSMAFYIKRIFEYYSTGMYSLESLGKKMFAEGFKDKYGKPYRARKFEEILKNIFYIGDFMWGGQRYAGTHKPIIEKKLFYKVQDRFGNTNKPKHNDKNFTYTNLIKCAECGCYFTAETKKGGKYTYYHCTNRKRQHTSLVGLSVREEVLDMAMQDIVNSIEIPDTVVKMLKDNIIASLDVLYKSENEIIDRQTRRIKELDQLITKSYEDKLLGRLPASYTEERYNMQCSKWQEERDMLAIQIKESGNINKTIYKNIDLIIDFCNRVPDIFLKADTDTKRQLLRMMIKDIQYANGELIVKLSPIFEALRLLKNYGLSDEESVKVRTLKKPTNSEVLEYLTNRITSGINAKVRTLETAIITEKTDSCEPVSKNGAGSGINLQPLYKFVAKQLIKTPIYELCA